MSGQQKSDTSQVSQNILPQWVQTAGQQNYGLAQQLAATPYNPAMNQNVAALSPQQQQATGLSQSNVGQAQNVTGQAIGGLTGLMGFQPGQVQGTNVTAGNVGTTNLNPYMDPYTQNVVNSNLALMEQQNKQALAGNNANAAAAGAFGGSRAANANAVQNAQNTLNEAQMQSGLMQQNFAQAQAAATGDINRQLQAATTNAQLGQQANLANQAAQISGAGVNLNAANSLIGGANALQGQNVQDVQGLLQTGALQQGQQQNVLNAATQNAQQQRAYDTGNLQMLLTSLGMTPYNTTQIGQSSTTQTSSDPMAAILGIGKIALGLPGLFSSDDTLKTDIKKVGQDLMSGLNIYAYRYRGDPKTYPKVIGLMASDVERKRPEAVVRIGGKRAVDYGLALGRT